MNAPSFRGLDRPHGFDRPHTACARCAGRFDAPDGPDEAFATLRIVEAEVVREDLCPSCFARAEPRPRPFWRRSLRVEAAGGAAAGASPPPGRRRRDADALERLFEELSRAEAAPADAPAERVAEGVGEVPAAVAPPDPAAASPDTASADRARAGSTSAAECGAAAPADAAADPAPLDPAPLDPAAIAALAAAEAARDEAQKLRYLTALALVRARRLELVEVGAGPDRGSPGGPAARLRVRRAGEPQAIDVEAPPIAAAELERLTSSLARQLGIG